MATTLKHHIGNAPPPFRVPTNTCLLLIKHGHQKVLGDAQYEFTPAVFDVFRRVILKVEKETGRPDDELRKIYTINCNDYHHVQALRAAFLEKT